MYLSRLVISNYRSIKYLDLEFFPTKNILIGQNNAGKSNIVRALNIILSEQQPDYKKYENITERDFHKNEADELFIIGAISRKDEEELDIKGLQSSSRGTYITRLPHIIQLPQDIEEIRDLVEKCMDFDLLENKRYIKKDSDEFVKFINSAQEFIYIFVANKDTDGSITKNLFLVIKNNEGLYLAQRPFIRSELIVSAVIPPFRDPNIHLRPSSWSWFGKLMKNKIEEAKRKTRKVEEKNGSELLSPFERISEAQEQIKQSANSIFADIIEDIKETSLSIGFDNAEIVFSFSGDDFELYKSVKIFIDDGISSPLEDKGAGIQSAVLISLFSHYVRKYQSQLSALLCIEEPEIYLHPHACRVLNNHINSFIEGERNQVILTTHNPVFIKPDGSGEGKIFRVYKNPNGETITTEIKFDSNFRNLFLRDENLELLFANKVIITEGLEKFIVRFLADFYFPNLIDSLNVSIISAEGKNDFPAFVNICKQLGISPFILADFDFFLRGLEKIYEEYVEQRMNKENFKNLKKLIGRLGSDYGKFKKEGKKLLDFPDKETEIGREMLNYIRDALDKLLDCGLLILEGEAEDIIKEEKRSDLLIDGKITLITILKIRTEIYDKEQDPKQIFTSDFIAQFRRFINTLHKW